MRRHGLMLVMVAVALLGGACGGAEPDRAVASVPGSSASASAAPAGEQDQFKACMKENGVDLDAAAGDGQSLTGDSGPITGQIDATKSPEQQRRELAALDKCRRHLPNGGNPQPLNPDELEQARAFAKCMRAAGVNYPDPDPNSVGDGTRAVPPGVDINDPAVLAKFRQCQRTSGSAPTTSGAGS